MPSKQAVLARYNLNEAVFNVVNLGNGRVGVCNVHPHDPLKDAHITIFDYLLPGGETEWYGLDRATHSTHRLGNTPNYLIYLLGSDVIPPETRRGRSREAKLMLPDYAEEHIWILPGEA